MDCDDVLGEQLAEPSHDDRLPRARASADPEYTAGLVLHPFLKGDDDEESGAGVVLFLQSLQLGPQVEVENDFGDAFF